MLLKVISVKSVLIVVQRNDVITTMSAVLRLNLKDKKCVIDKLKDSSAAAKYMAHNGSTLHLP